MKNALAALVLVLASASSANAQDGITTLDTFLGLPSDIQYGYLAGVYETHVLAGAAGAEFSCKAPTGTSRNSVVSMVIDQLKNTNLYPSDSSATVDIYKAMCALWPPSASQNSKNHTAG